MNVLSVQSAVVELVSGSDFAAVEKLAAFLEEGAISPRIPLSAIVNLLEPMTVYPYLLAQVLRAWENSFPRAPGSWIAACVRSALGVRMAMETSVPRQELVWTGPYAPVGLPIRATISVVDEMIQNATRKVFVLGYSLTSGHQGSTRIIEALAGARRRGSEVTLALHDTEENLIQLMRMWPTSSPKPRLLRWVGRPGDSMASLHAKMIVVDSNDILVTSANLTYHGLEQNIEVGIRVSGNLALYVDRHLAYLEQEGILVTHRDDSSKRRC